MNYNDRQNVLIIVGVLAIAMLALAGIIMVPSLADKARDSLTQLLTLIVGGMLGFLSRGMRTAPGTGDGGNA